MIRTPCRVNAYQDTILLVSSSAMNTLGVLGVLIWFFVLLGVLVVFSILQGVPLHLLIKKRISESPIPFFKALPLYSHLSGVQILLL